MEFDEVKMKEEEGGRERGREKERESGRKRRVSLSEECSINSACSNSTLLFQYTALLTDRDGCN